jgi:hypothetical protein
VKAQGIKLRKQIKNVKVWRSDADMGNIDVIASHPGIQIISLQGMSSRERD